MGHPLKTFLVFAVLGVLLDAGSRASMMMVFAGAYAMAWFVRRQWR